MIVTDRIADLLAHTPLSGHATLDHEYDWMAIDRAAGRFKLSIDGREHTETNFDEFPCPLKEHILDGAKWPTLYAHYGIADLIEERCRGLSGTEQQEIEDYYRNGLQLLLNAPNDVLALYRVVMDTYHDGEHTLKTLLFRGSLRAHYNSNASLIHIDTTGPSRGGKDKLTSRYLSFLPPRTFFHYSSSSSKAAYYATLKQVRDDKTGKASYEENPDYYKGKVVVISEVADSSGFTALKALGEEDQYSTRRHQTITNGYYQTFSVRGPRCVIMLSVRGIAESDTNEVKNRFFQAPIEKRNEESILKRNLRLEDNLERGFDVRDDPRTEFVTAALEIVYHNGFNVRFERPIQETSDLLKALVKLFTDTGFNTTQIGQFYSLCESAAFQKRYYRRSPEVCRIEVDDVLESWTLVQHFAKETVMKLSEAYVKVLDAVYPLTDEEIENLGYKEFDPLQKYGDNELTRAPTQADIVRRGLSKGTVSKALKAEGGALIDADLVYNEFSAVRNTTVYRRTDLSEGMAAKLSKLGAVMCGNKQLMPLDPATNGVSRFPSGFQDEWKLKEVHEVRQSDLQGFYKDIIFRFPSFQDNMGDGTRGEPSTTPICIENQETWEPKCQKDNLAEESASEPDNGNGQVSETKETLLKPQKLKDTESEIELFIRPIEAACEFFTTEQMRFYSPSELKVRAVAHVTRTNPTADPAIVVRAFDLYATSEAGHAKVTQLVRNFEL